MSLRYVYSDRRRQSCDAVTWISAGRRILFSPCIRLFRNRNLVKRLLIFAAMISTVAVAARKSVRNACGGPVFIYTPFSVAFSSSNRLGGAIRSGSNCYACCWIEPNIHLQPMPRDSCVAVNQIIIKREQKKNCNRPSLINRTIIAFRANAISLYLQLFLWTESIGSLLRNIWFEYLNRCRCSCTNISSSGGGGNSKISKPKKRVRN